jgi:hypothetical protein
LADESNSLKTVESYEANASSPLLNVLAGSREKAPQSLSSTYWDTFFPLLGAPSRVFSATSSSLAQSTFFMPAFDAYVDYDFRNAQALEMLEELFWEHPFSAYTFYDYVALRRPSVTAQLSTLRHTNLRSGFSARTTNSELAASTMRDTSSLGRGYSCNVQVGDYLASPSLTTRFSLSQRPLHFELSGLEDNIVAAKGQGNLLTKLMSPS